MNSFRDDYPCDSACVEYRFYAGEGEVVVVVVCADLYSADPYNDSHGLLEEEGEGEEGKNDWVSFLRLYARPYLLCARR